MSHRRGSVMEGFCSQKGKETLAPKTATVNYDSRERYPKRVPVPVSNVTISKRGPLSWRQLQRCLRPAKDTNVPKKSGPSKSKGKKDISKVQIPSKDTLKSDDSASPLNKYLWTRLVCSKDGYKKYEVYKEDSAENLPISKQTPVIVFLVLPNAFLMPFVAMPVAKKRANMLQ